jgi:O-antigen ligase
MTDLAAPPGRILGAASPVRSSHALTPGAPAAALGPFATAFASIYLTIAFVIAAPSVPLQPWVWTITLGFAVGALLLAPREHWSRVVIDGPLLLLVAWIAMSLLWSFNFDFGLFLIRKDVPLWIAASVMASLLPREEAINAIRRGLTFSVAATIVALIAFPETRSHGSGGIYLEDYPGWHGFFIHKNELAPYLIFALVFVLQFDREPIRRALSLAVITVLIVGSDSATGMSTAMFVAVVIVWFRFFRRGTGRRSTAFVVSSIAVGLVGLMGIVASLSAITNSFGKDLTFSGRTFIWNGVINAIQERPFLGYGVAGVFRDTTSEITRTVWRDVGFHIPHSHSGALDVWIEFGLVGVVLFGLMFITSIGKGVRLLRVSPAMGEFVLTIMAAQLLMGLSENVFLGSWLVYGGVVRALAQRELNDLAREHTVPAASDDARRDVDEPVRALGSGRTAV